MGLVEWYERFCPIVVYFSDALQSEHLLRKKLEADDRRMLSAIVRSSVERQNEKPHM